LRSPSGIQITAVTITAVVVLGCVYWLGSKSDPDEAGPTAWEDTTAHDVAEAAIPQNGDAHADAASAPEATRSDLAASTIESTVIELRTANDFGAPVTDAEMLAELVTPGFDPDLRGQRDGALHTLAIPIDATPHASEEIVVDLALRAPGHAPWKRRVAVPIASRLDLGTIHLSRGHVLDAIVRDVFGAPLATANVLVFPSEALSRYRGQTIIQPRIASASEHVALRTDDGGRVGCDSIPWDDVAVAVELVSGLWTPLAFDVDLTQDLGRQRAFSSAVDVRDRTVSGIVDAGDTDVRGTIEIECLTYDADVAVASDRRRVMRFPVSDDRTFTVAPSPGTAFDVRAVCRESAARSDWQRNVTLGTGGLTLVLRPIRTLTVEVRGATSHCARVQAYVLPKANFAGTTRPPLIPRLDQCTGDGAGVLRILEPDVAFGVRVSAGDGRVGCAGPFEVGEAPDSISIELPRDTTRIEGRVHVAAGMRPDGIPVSLYYRATQPLSVSGFDVVASMLHSRTITRADGSFTFYPPIRAELIVTTSTTDHGFGAVDVDPLEPEAVQTVELRPRVEFGAASGVLSSTGTPGQRMVAATNGMGVFRTTWVDASGNFRFDRLPVGEWQFAEVSDAPWQGLLGADDARPCEESVDPARASIVADRCVDVGFVRPKP
jgi:hypothetical protein